MGARRKTPPDQASLDPWTSLQRHWEQQARSAHGSVILDWAARAPGLANFDSPLEVTATIRSLGDPERSWALLADLLIVAHLDSLAGEAVLVALIPGLRAASNRRWRIAKGAGPWCDQFELDMDTITAAWETINRAAGQRHERPSRLIIRSVERQLRTRHEAHCRTANRSVALIEADNTSISRLADQDTVHHAVAVVQAVRRGLLDPTSAALVYRVAVGGEHLGSVARQLGVGVRRARLLLARADNQLNGRPRRRTDTTPTCNSPQEDSPVLPLLLNANQAAQLIGVSRTTVYDLIDAGALQAVHRGRSRRIPLWAVYEYVDQLCGGRYQSIPIRTLVDYLARVVDDGDLHRRGLAAATGADSTNKATSLRRTKPPGGRQPPRAPTSLGSSLLDEKESVKND